MALKTTVSISYNKLPAIAARLPKAADQINRKTAFDIQRGAIDRTTRVDTGAMKGGYVVEQLDATTWIIYNSVFYHIFHEFGTVHISALGMLIPAAEENRAPFIAAYKQLEALIA
jgi:hypothetical protein